jgi:hypothetical protein
MRPVRKADNLPPSCVPLSLNLWNLNLLKTSGPVQACNGNALPLPSGLNGPGKSVGIATDYELDGPESNPGRYEIFRPLGQSPVKRVPVLSRG